MLFEVWGLSLNQTVVIVVAILVVVDFFIPTDLPTHIGYVLLCVLVAVNVDAHILVKLLCALLAWFVFVAFHYWIWRGFAQRVVDRFIAPDRIKTGGDGLVGEKGEIRDLDGVIMVRVRGDLWSCSGVEKLQGGDIVNIVGNKGGVLDVTKAEGNT